jgi:hypothetical protein
LIFFFSPYFLFLTYLKRPSKSLWKRKRKIQTIFQEFY